MHLANCNTPDNCNSSAILLFSRHHLHFWFLEVGTVVPSRFSDVLEVILREEIVVLWINDSSLFHGQIEWIITDSYMPVETHKVTFTIPL